MSDDAAHLAVIGLACRLPGASSPDELWSNLARGVESITFFDEHGAVSTDPPAPVESGAIRACGTISEPAGFDAPFFGFTPLEATITDPEQRVLLECAYEAFENAGYDPMRYKGAIGIYAGGSETSYLATLRAHRHELAGADDWQLKLGTGIDFLTSRVAYKLGLRGPAVTVQTACSTSLVAIHLAAQALLAGDCDMALAGGASLHVPVSLGHYTEGGVLSPDGRCRAFDAAASGTVGSDGVAIVLLKRLADALADGDNVWAVMRGSAINNDASAKIGFTAPSVEGQAKVIRTAQAVADVTPESIGYVEAHGTGTRLGDPVEVAALTKAFGARSGGSPCFLGSVKTNIGHTDAAAGAAGFMKAVLALRHRQIPPSLHFRSPNPQIDFATSGFAVVTELRAWEPPDDDSPRRAGVSSLGIGGTNAHVILEEAPATEPRADRRSGHQLVVVSAKSEAALASVIARLGDHLGERPDASLADVAWTLQRGRQAHAHRRFVVAGDVASAAHALAVASTEPPPRPCGGAPPRVAFLFPGHGGQSVGMARELYESQSVFRDTIDRCSTLVAADLGVSLRDVLYPPRDDMAANERATTRLVEMTTSQVALFAVEVALTKLWARWGVVPDVVLGHSLGGYAAAVAAGAVTLEGGLRLVLARGKILTSLPEGAMLAIPLPEREVTSLLEAGAAHRISIAAINGPEQCTVAGTPEAIAALRAELEARGIDVRLLRIPRAGHSHVVEPFLEELAGAAATVERRAPEIAWISEITGELMTPETSVDPRYWTNHFRRTVRFGDALRTLLADSGTMLLELGPGRTLVALARQHPAYAGHPTASSLPHPAEPTSDVACALGAAGRVWTAGRSIEWRGLHDGRTWRRLPLPTYPFERSLHLVPRGVPAAAPAIASAKARGSTDDLAADAPNVVERVADLFAAVLGLPRIGVQANFFELGGDSLMAVQLARRAREAFGVTLKTTAIFRAPTPEALARVIASAGAPAG